MRVLNEVKKQLAGAVTLEHPYHAIAGIQAKKKLDVKLTMPENNIEFNRSQQLQKRWWRLLFSNEKRGVTRPDLIIFKTESDQGLGLTVFLFKKTQIG